MIMALYERKSCVHPSFLGSLAAPPKFSPELAQVDLLQATAGLAQLVEVLTAEMVVPSPVVDVK